MKVFGCIVAFLTLIAFAVASLNADLFIYGIIALAVLIFLCLIVFAHCTHGGGRVGGMIS